MLAMSLICFSIYCKVISHENTGKRRQINITPNRKGMMRSLSRRSYKAAASRFAQLPQTRGHLLKSLVKCVNSEIKNICSHNHNSVLRGSHEAIKTFSWETVWHELADNVPTHVEFFNHLLPKSDNKFVSFLICAVIKKKCKHMSLIQRAFSFLLYLNGTNKQLRILNFAPIVFH